MPTTGSAEFRGYSAIFIDPVLATDDDDVVMLGDVTMTVTFANSGTVTGTADNFDAVLGDGPTGRLASVSGSIAIGGNNSAIGDNRDANEWNSDYAGTLTVEGETYTITGDLDGGFLGNRPGRPPATYIKGIYGIDNSGLSFDSDGDDAPVSFEILGTNPG